MFLFLCWFYLCWFYLCWLCVTLSGRKFLLFLIGKWGLGKMYFLKLFYGGSLKIFLKYWFKFASFCLFVLPLFSIYFLFSFVSNFIAFSVNPSSFLTISTTFLFLTFWHISIHFVVCFCFHLNSFSVVRAIFIPTFCFSFLYTFPSLLIHFL